MSWPQPPYNYQPLPAPPQVMKDAQQAFVVSIISLFLPFLGIVLAWAAIVSGGRILKQWPGVGRAGTAQGIGLVSLLANIGLVIAIVAAATST